MLNFSVFCVSVFCAKNVELSSNKVDVKQVSMKQVKMVILQRPCWLLIPSRGLLNLDLSPLYYHPTVPSSFSLQTSWGEKLNCKSCNCRLLSQSQYFMGTVWIDQSAAFRKNSNRTESVSPACCLKYITTLLFVRTAFGVSTRPARFTATVEFFGRCVNLNSKQRLDFSGGQRPLFMCFRTCLFVRKPLRLPCCRGGKINPWQYKPRGLHHSDSFRPLAQG